MNISDFAELTIGLSATPPSQANFSVPMLLVDDANVPIDRRYIQTTKSTYQTDLTAATDAYTWCTTLWGQNYNVAQAYIGRWVSTASTAYMYFPLASTDYTDYVTLAGTAKIKIVEGVADEDISPDFTGDTSMADVAASIQTALQAGTLTAGYTCTIDPLGRLVIWSDLTGAAADSVSAATPATGTDLLLTTGASTSQDGLDAEPLGTALAAILALDNTPFIICERGASIAQAVALATSANALAKILLLVVNDTNAKNPAISTDVGYQLEALGYNRCHVEYTEHTTQNPDATICGEIMPQTEGTVSFALWPLTGVSRSGLDGDGTTAISLTVGERAALDAKGYDYLAKPATVTHFVRGLAPGGNELRIMILKMFIEAKVDEDVYGYMIAQKVVTFSDADIMAVKGIIEKWLEEGVERKGLEAGYTLDMPAASDFTAAAKATHIMDLDDLTQVETQRSVNSINMSLSWSV